MFRRFMAVAVLGMYGIIGLAGAATADTAQAKVNANVSVLGLADITLGAVAGLNL